MSCEGVLVRQKHGGPHGIPHESRLNVNIDLNDEFRAKNEGLTTIQSAEDSQIIQDGVGIDEKNVVEDNLHFLSADDDLDSYERAVVENNAEWLKSRCRNLETVDFDITGNVQDDASVADLFDSDPLPDDGASIVSDGVLNFTRQLCVGPASVPTLCVSTSNINILHGQPRDVLDELTNPGLNVGSHGKALHVQNLGLLDADKNNTLMTPQELESMPDRGIEFEESVGPKSDTIQIVQIEDGVPSEFEKCISGQATQSLTSILDGKTKRYDTSLLNRVNVQSSNQSALVQKSRESSMAQLSQSIVAPAEAYVPTDGNLKLATISISTDKASNSTQILVNTNQGQQLYHINTADLTQATNALEPLSRPNSFQTVAASTRQLKTLQQMEANVATTPVTPVQTG